MYTNQQINNIQINEIINQEVTRLTNIFEKDFLDCDDLIKLTGLGRDNVLTLMHSQELPTKQIGRRRIVSITAYVLWKFDNKRTAA